MIKAIDHKGVYRIAFFCDECEREIIGQDHGAVVWKIPSGDRSHQWECRTVHKTCLGRRGAYSRAGHMSHSPKNKLFGSKGSRDAPPLLDRIALALETIAIKLDPNKIGDDE